jgi:hypothetical protein
MNKPFTDAAEFALVTPLQWPENVSDRVAYEQELIRFAQYMAPLIAASQNEQVEIFLSSLHPIIPDLESLWMPSKVPPDVELLLQVFHSRSAKSY